MKRVVLVHGLWRSCASLGRLNRRLSKAGYDVHCFGYPSRRHRLSGHIAEFRRWLKDLPGEGSVHFVGHSLGGLIIRGALADDPPLEVGRIVLIATPNQGAVAANHFSDWWLSRLIFGKPLADLAENSPALAQLGVPVADIGIISGAVRIHPFNPISWINHSQLSGHDHDGTVKVANTRLDGVRDSLVVKAHHTFICDDAEVIRQSMAFLKNGLFDQA